MHGILSAPASPYSDMLPDSTLWAKRNNHFGTHYHYPTEKTLPATTQEEYRKAAIDAVKKLSADVGIPSVLEAVKEEDLQFLAESAHADACAPGNPKDASVEDLKDLFRKLM